MPQIQLVITMDDTGAINVSGPTQNQMLSFGLLEMAKVAIIDHNKQAQQRVQPAPPGLVIPKMPGT